MGKTKTAAKTKASTSSPASPSKKYSWSPGSRVVSSERGVNLREQNFDLFQTQVEGVYIGVCTKSWSTGEASYLFPMEKCLNDRDNGMCIAMEWKHVFGFLPRRDISINDGTTAMKSKRGSKWDWKAVVVVINDESPVEKVGHHIANCFSKLTRNKDVMDNPEKYSYRQCISNAPKALNHYLLDLDVTKVLKSLVFDNGGYKTKDELIENEEVLADFYGNAEIGMEYLEAMEEMEWDNLVDGDGDGH